MLSVENISQRYDDKTILANINLVVQPGEILCLLGESGSGKTTLLRIIAGLETGFSGDVYLANEPISQVPVYLRDMGMVFQDFALFPHMNVIQNVAFGLRMQGQSKVQRQKRAHEMLELVGLSGFETRDVGWLSGGEKQRVALARALAPSPALLLLDEPLGALDASLKERLVVDLRHIIKDVGLTAIHVTHDQQEAFAIADRIALLHDGQLVQVDTPQQLYARPKTRFAAEFLGLRNVVSAKLLRKFGIQYEAGQYLLHPDGLSMADDGSVCGMVTERVFRGNYFQLTVQVDDVQLRLSLAANKPIPAEGDVVRLHIDPAQVIELAN